MSDLLDKERAADLYKQDYYAWTKAQAAALRRLAEERWNGPLDLENLAEEVESLGRSDYRAVASQLRRIIEHCLKLEHSLATEPRSVWRRSVLDARVYVADRLTASLRIDIEQDLARVYKGARRLADDGLRAHGEEGAASALPDTCPYTLDQLLDDDWFPANRHGLVDPV